MLLLIFLLFSFIQEKVHAPQTAKTPTVQHKTLDPDAALLNLKEGNKRFLSGHIKTEGQSKKDVERLSLGQAPNAIVVSCSDSRVPLEAVFDQKLGEVFAVRTAGEVLSPQAIGSMEFAIENFGSRLLVILGHTNCGAVIAALDTLSGGSAGSKNRDQFRVVVGPDANKNLEDLVLKVNLGFDGGSVTKSDVAAYIFQNLNKLISESDIKNIRSIHFDE